jgi:Mg-chelatase subunit ChlD
MAEYYVWMTSDNVSFRLAQGLALARNIVSLAFADAVRVDWSSPGEAFEGVMIRECPPRILLNPRIVLQRKPHQARQAVVALCGVALHEGAHARFTPPNWGRRLRALLAAHARETGDQLPDALVLPVCNWAEDVFIESMLARSYPGFEAYFRGAWTYFLRPSTCRRRLRQVEQLLPRYHRAPGAFTAGATLVAAIIELVVVAVQQPVLVGPRIAAALPEVNAAAIEIRAAGAESSLDRRLARAIRATEILFRYVQDFLPPSQPVVPLTASHTGGRSTRAPVPPGAAGPGTGDSTRAARELARILHGRKPLLRDDSDPLGVRPVTRRALPPASVDDRAGQLPQDAGTPIDHPPAVCPSARWISRIVESSPETVSLPVAEVVRRARELFEAHRARAEELRRRLQLPQLPREYIEYGQRSGEIDDAQLALVPTGSQELYYRRDVQAARRADLTLLVDESGSMKQERRWELATVAALCIEYAVRNLEGVRLRVYGFTEEDTSITAVLYRHYDSAIPRLRRPWALGYMYPKGLTPTGIALAALHEELRRARPAGVSPAVLLISDGAPRASGYRGNEGYAHVAGEVQRLRAAGIQFVALQIGSSTSDARLTEMYGQRWQRLSRADEIPSAVATVALRYLPTEGYPTRK